MIDRRMLTTLLASAAVAPALSPRQSWGQAAKSKAVFYASVGSELTLYGMKVEDATLEKRGVVTLPANVQYAWPHPSKQYFYVVSSGGGPRWRSLPPPSPPSQWVKRRATLVRWEAASELSSNMFPRP
jgi:hypothetical protein